MTGHGNQRAETEPLAVYDVHDPSWPDQPITEIGDWLRRQGINPDDTYRFEVHLLDCLFARVYQYDRDENGRAYCPRDHEHQNGKIYGPGEEPSEAELCDIARRAPFDLPIKEMPPVKPARGAA